MKLLFESWQKYLKEEEINEVTEDELENIEDILNDLDAEDLSFGNIFLLIILFAADSKSLSKLSMLFPR